MLVFERFKKFKGFLGPRVFTLLLFSIGVGMFWFAIEAAFVYVLQGFVFSLKITSIENLFLPSWYPTSLKATSIILVVYGLFRSIGRFFLLHLTNLTQQAFLRTQRERLLHYMFHNFSSISPNEAISIFTEIITQSGLFVYYCSQLVIVLTTALFLSLMGLRLAFWEMVTGILFLAAVMLPIRFLSRRIGTYGKEITSQWEKTNKTLLFGFKNFFFIKLHGLINEEIDRGSKGLKNAEENYRKYSLMAAFNGSFPQFAGIFLVSVLTLLGIHFFKTPGIKLITFFYLFIRMTQAASDSSNTLSYLRLSLPGFKKLYAWHERAMAFARNEMPPSKKVDFEKIEIDVSNLNFAYGDKTPVISDLSFSIKKGEPLLIKGPSGAGKSTLLSLLTGILTPNSGQIKYNGMDLKDIQTNLPPYLGYVGPEPYLFEGTVRENLLYGNKNKISDEDIWESLKLVQLFSTINNLEHKLDENLHEYTQLSTGQKQRLAMSRALLRNPKFLILDEATANLDVQTEMGIIQALDQIKDSVSLVIISHKDNFDNLATNRLQL
ncbi:MAG: ATP-binding cassette domain-containing protein [Bacteriovoracales bacterium]